MVFDGSEFAGLNLQGTGDETKIPHRNFNFVWWDVLFDVVYILFVLFCIY